MTVYLIHVIECLLCRCSMWQTLPRLMLYKNEVNKIDAPSEKCQPTSWREILPAKNTIKPNVSYKAVKHWNHKIRLLSTALQSWKCRLYKNCNSISCFNKLEKTTIPLWALDLNNYMKYGEFEQATRRKI